MSGDRPFPNKLNSTPKMTKVCSFFWQSGSIETIKQKKTRLQLQYGRYFAHKTLSQCSAMLAGRSSYTVAAGDFVVMLLVAL